MQSTDTISVRLTVAEWNIVIDVLQDGRHRIVRPIIDKIIEQAQQAEQAEGERTAPHLVG